MPTRKSSPLLVRNRIGCRAQTRVSGETSGSLQVSTRHELNQATCEMVPTKCNARLCTLQQQEGRRKEPCRFGKNKRVLAWQKGRHYYEQTGSREERQVRQGQDGGTRDLPRVIRSAREHVVMSWAGRRAFTIQIRAHGHGVLARSVDDWIIGLKLEAGRTQRRRERTTTRHGRRAHHQLPSRMSS